MKKIFPKTNHTRLWTGRDGKHRRHQRNCLSLMHYSPQYGKFYFDSFYQETESPTKAYIKCNIISFCSFHCFSVLSNVSSWKFIFTCLLCKTTKVTGKRKISFPVSFLKRTLEFVALQGRTINLWNRDLCKTRKRKPCAGTRSWIIFEESNFKENYLGHFDIMHDSRYFNTCLVYETEMHLCGQEENIAKLGYLTYAVLKFVGRNSLLYKQQIHLAHI